MKTEGVSVFCFASESVSLLARAWGRKSQTLPVGAIAGGRAAGAALLGGPTVSFRIDEGAGSAQLRVIRKPGLRLHDGGLRGTTTRSVRPRRRRRWRCHSARKLTLGGRPWPALRGRACDGAVLDNARRTTPPTTHCRQRSTDEARWRTYPFLTEPLQNFGRDGGSPPHLPAAFAHFADLELRVGHAHPSLDSIED